ncbi:MAG: TonB-dependent receptor [Bacteroidales bacterium]|jgi:outer membrane receptor for ferrienterochelin and colicins|nr:TonB-dependent receptor [Bacteroidales bacterium]
MKKEILTIITSFSLSFGVLAQVDSMRITELNPVVVTGTGTYHTADNSPVAVKVISAKELKEVQATNVQDALNKLTPNITLHTNGMGSFVNFNGVSDDYLLIMENGKRVSGDDRWSRISLDNVKRIEVFSGAASALYGSDAIAGVINIITEEGNDLVEATSRTKVMDHGRMNHDVNVDVNVKKFSSFTSYNFRKADNWQVNKYQEFIETDKDGNEQSVIKLNGRPMSQGFQSHNISEKLEWRFNDHWQLYLTGDYYDYVTTRPENAISFTQKKSTDKSTGEIKYSYTPKAAYTYDLHHNSYKYGGGSRWTPNDSVSVFMDVYCDNVTSKYDYWQTDEAEAYDETRKSTHYVNESLKGIFRLANWNKLSGGLEFVQESLNSESDNISHETTNTYNVFAQEELTVAKWFDIVAGVRYTYNTNFGSHVTPNVGLFYHIGGFRIRTSYAGGYKTPTLSQLYATDQAKTSSRYTINNAMLKAEKNHFGTVNLEYGNNWMNIGVTGFVNKIMDMINYRTLTEEEIMADPKLTELNKEWTTIRQRDNIDNALLRGINTNVKFITKAGLSFGGGYAFTDGEVDKAVRHVGNANVSYDKTWNKYHLNVAVNGHVQGKRFSSTYGYADGYSQWNLNTRHTITMNQFVLEPGIGIENLFNEVDDSYWNSNYSTISPGRSFYVSLALKFKN